MPYKYDADKNIVVQEIDGKKLPVFIHADGKESVLDGDSTISTIGRLNAEAKSHRERAEAAEKGLKNFDGIDDADAARKALDTVKNLDHKKLVDAGEVEKVKSEISKAFETKLSESDARAKALESQLYDEKIGGSFSRSKMIAEKLAIPADLVQARFGSSFKVEDGKIVAHDQSGNKIYSRSRPGELADFDEALESLIEIYPHKDHIMKSSGSSGGGGQSGSITQGREQINPNMSPTERMTAARAAGGKK